ncbi:Uncharacterised protein [Bordetella ansorpii]|uniref:Plasmid replication/partition related protein n=1 Tax=Bordetella ansorpii TaxID=288768 RepID=A0A157Q397_9BORD|nr:hypothetical protein [Bordetella ansorpii]SAI40345.1 Uncharacterised protein [Bordetella ansorpii]
MTTIRIEEELRAYIEPLTPDEYTTLERSILAEGCRDALVLWGDLLIDGHNRYEICTKHGIPYRTVQNERFRSMDDVRLWMIENHLGRRSVSDFQRGVLVLRKKEILEMRAQAAPADPAGQAAEVAQAPVGDPTAPWEESAGDGPAPVSHALQAARTAAAVPVPSRQAMAREARLSSIALGQIEKIRKQAAPEVLRAVQSGGLSINAAAAVSTLPPERQAAAAVGGAKSLREAAREARALAAAAKPLPDPPELPPLPENAEEYPAALTKLAQRVAELTQERDALKKKVAQLTIALSQARRGGEE